MGITKNYVEFDIQDDSWDGFYGTSDICEGFDHSFGVFSGDGLFCWPNRYGKKTFANSNRDGRLDLLVICKKDEIEIISGGYDCQDECDEEHTKDGKPHFQTPGIEDLIPFVTRLKFEDSPIIYDEAGYLISRLLTPSNGYTPREERLYNRNRWCLPEEFVEKAKTMPYREFLLTPYWRILSDEVKSKRKVCQMCGSSKNLEVHHTTYDIRGNEPRNLDKLQVLCHKCHSKVHGKEK